jgi:predicted lysophospholipase L1 biosynthesis ABC-type transport system permease subunit
VRPDRTGRIVGLSAAASPPRRIALTISSVSGVGLRVGRASGTRAPFIGTIAAPLVVLAAGLLLLWSDTGMTAVVLGGLVVLALVVALVLLAIAGARLGYDETGRERP